MIRAAVSSEVHYAGREQGIMGVVKAEPNDHPERPVKAAKVLLVT